MKGVLQFKLPEEETEFEMAFQASRLMGAVQDYDNWLRGKIKYGELPPGAEDVYQTCRDELYRILGECEVTLW